MDVAQVEKPEHIETAIVVNREELQEELSWLMLRVHRIRKLLRLEPILTPRQKRRQRHKHQ